MNYTEIINDIFNLARTKGVNRGLENIQKLCEIYNQPQNSFSTVHVTGTNGKGSTCLKMAAALQEEGYRCGLYTSPHIASFRERIRINGEMIPEKEVAAIFSELQTILFFHSIPASFFEISTFLAFLYFQRQKVDIAIIEVGMGGRWDATNVIHPLVSVVTSIGFDHTDFLGDTLEKISQEKAGIIKEKVPVVLGRDVPPALFVRIAKERNCPLIQSRVQNPDFDRENQETARLALSLLTQFPLSKHSLEKGLAVRPPCRFEKMGNIVLDVAHNAHGFARLIEKLKQEYPNRNYRFVVGFSKGKDISECAQLLHQTASSIHLVSGPHPRLASVQEIAEVFPDSQREITIAQGIQNAIRLANNEIVVIAGSFFIMHDARKALGLQDPEDPCIWYDPLKTIGCIKGTS